MEGVGARLGRSSTRYGPATVFTGPVRKWKKKWVHVSPSSASNHHSQTNGNNNGNNGSHLLLYKWTPISQSSNNGTNADKNSAKDSAAATAAPEEPPRRKFKYIPVGILHHTWSNLQIAVLEEQKREDAEKADDEAKPSDADLSAAEPTLKTNGFDEKPDINDVPMEENQALDQNQLARQDLNESTLDLSLGLKAHDGDPDSDSKTNQNKDG
ncbi:uncharacterized protein LOC117923963 isoform X2 [Vitis riparia]|uniref:uncharacterized protein LOC117923963 isoform X2 n=1 Tax=Vitis riparia TaxID=96939 RepID=UPI00155B1029|nr:uncharacterized protein LOC117923963 isoform X2 [Vitis riparia]